MATPSVRAQFRERWRTSMDDTIAYQLMPAVGGSRIARRSCGQADAEMPSRARQASLRLAPAGARSSLAASARSVLRSAQIRTLTHSKRDYYVE
jgi:hypothetical protein